MRRPLLISVAALALGMAVPATGAALTEGSATQLQVEVKRLIAEWLRPFRGLMDITFDGQIVVVPSGDHYLLRTPAGTINLLDVETDFPPDVMVMRPAGEGQYEVLQDIPTGPVGAFLPEWSSMLYGGGQWTALLDLAAGWAVAYEMRLDDLVETHAVSQYRKSFDTLFVSLTNTLMAPGIADTRIRLVYEGYESFNPLMDVRTSAERGGFDFGFVSLNVADLAQMVELLSIAVRQAADLQMDDGELLALLQPAFEGTPALFSDAALTVQLNHVRYEMPEGPLALDEIVASCDLVDFAAEISAAECRLILQGGPDEAEETGGAQAGPTEFRLEIGLAQFPRAAIVDAIAQALGDGAVIGGEASAHAAGDAIYEALLAARSEFVLRDFGLTTPDFAIAAEGHFRLEPTSPRGLTAAAMLTFSNFDVFLEGLEAFPDMQLHRQLLGAIRPFGRDYVDAEGTPVLRFELELIETGEVLVNGTDVGVPL